MVNGIWTAYETLPVNPAQPGVSVDIEELTKTLLVLFYVSSDRESAIILVEKNLTR